MPRLVSAAATRRTLADRLRGLQQVFELVVPVPEEWLGEQARVTVDLAILSPCVDYRKMVLAWRKAMKWTEGLDAALSVMLASAASTGLLGEQLWIKVIGPPSSGKTTILEGLNLNKQYVFPKDTIRGFYQGWKSEDGSDMSVASMANRKTLTTKDGDSLLKTPNLQQILSEARGLYDGAGRTHYRNAVMNDYEGHRMTWLLCGTKSLREIDESELGTRFLDVVVMESIDDDFEDEVAWRAVNQEANAMLAESNGDPDHHHPAALTDAMKLTGGYLSYLRENVVELLSQIECTPADKRKCAAYGKFVAYLRARPTRDRDDTTATREFSARLAKQHMRLSQVLAVVLNRKQVEGEALERTRRVALDTSRGKTLDLVQLLYHEGKDGRIAKSLGSEAGQYQADCRRMLRFLRSIGAVESFKVKGQSGDRWRLTPMLHRLYRKVMEEK